LGINQDMTSEITGSTGSVDVDEQMALLARGADFVESELRNRLKEGRPFAHPAGAIRLRRTCILGTLCSAE
jgi:hypothetical protein